MATEQTPRSRSSSSRAPKQVHFANPTPTDQEPMTPLQRHIAFWDQDRDGIIHPLDVYAGFRALGFSVLFSLGSLLIPPLLLAKHGSDTGVYDVDGGLRENMLAEMFARYDIDQTGGLSAGELWRMIGRNRCAADVAGWAFSFMEWGTTWLLLQEDGRVWREDLWACYDGNLFWRIADGRKRRDEAEPAWQKGYGIEDFAIGMWNYGTWKTWEHKGPKPPRGSVEDTEQDLSAQTTPLIG
ncbi:hypothetical protein PG985_003007 [Apiospora marii]|uniref:uncharacterized protein n=1 Tax=Apiospora marii TaxID=335849 RepID=UPI00312EA023